METLTIAKVNKALKSAGFDAVLVKGRGYMWFDGDEPDGWYSSSVAVPHLSSIPTLEGWIEKYRSMKADHDACAA